jgi:hypothetical protein
MKTFVDFDVTADGVTKLLIAPLNIYTAPDLFTNPPTHFFPIVGDSIV